MLAKVRSTWEKNDAAAYSRLFTHDGVLVAPTGQIFRGQEEGAQATEGIIKLTGGIKSFNGTIEDAHALADGAIGAVGHAAIAGNHRTTKDHKDHWAAIGVPDGNELKVSMLSLGIDLPPRQPQTPQTPSPSEGSGTSGLR